MAISLLPYSFQWLIVPPSASVFNRWHAGARDDGWSSFEKIQASDWNEDTESLLDFCTSVCHWDFVVLTPCTSNALYCAVTCSVLMLDEAHERTLYTDIAIGLLKKVMLGQSIIWTTNHFTCQTIIFVIQPQKTQHKIKPFFFLFFSPRVLVLCSIDSEEAARPEADCGLSHSGRQGDCIIKMNRYVWAERNGNKETDKGKSWCQVRPHCTDICDALTKKRHNEAMAVLSIKRASWNAISAICRLLKMSFNLNLSLQST